MLMRVLGHSTLASLLVLAQAVTCQVQAQPAAAPAAPLAANAGQSLDASATRTWLARLQEAAAQQDYQGTLVFSAGGRMHSARIVHVCNGKDTLERIDALDGQRRQVFRQNRWVHTFLPENRLVVIEQRDPVADFPSLLQGSTERVAEYYDLRKLGVDRVAGYEADVLHLVPKDAARFGHRLWAERKTGLLLRAEVLGERQQILEATAFTELSLGPRLTADALLQSMPRTEGLRVVKRASTPVKLEAEGWVLREAVPGFQQISCMRRPLPGHEVGRDVGPDAAAVQVVFSDGMTYVSLFIEPFGPNQDQQTLQAAVGATHTLMRRKGDWLITVMGDVPMSTLQRFFAVLERRR